MTEEDISHPMVVFNASCNGQENDVLFCPATPWYVEKHWYRAPNSEFMEEYCNNYTLPYISCREYEFLAL